MRLVPEAGFGDAWKGSGLANIEFRRQRKGIDIESNVSRRLLEKVIAAAIERQRAVETHEFPMLVYELTTPTKDARS